MNVHVEVLDFTESSIFRKMTVRDNLMAILETRVRLPLEREEKLDALLEKFNIGHIVNSLGRAVGW